MSEKIAIFMVFIFLFSTGALPQTKDKIGVKPDVSHLAPFLPNKSGHKDKIYAKLYFTLADAERISGAQMQIQAESDDGFESFCKYRPVNNSSHVVVEAIFQIHKSARRAKAAEGVTKKLTAELEASKSIKKIKDGVWLLTTGNTQMINVRRRNITFQIHVLDNTGKRLSPEIMTEISERITRQLDRDRTLKSRLSQNLNQNRLFHFSTSLLNLSSERKLAMRGS